MALNQRQVMSLQQKLSPQQIQMIKLLELPTVQLEQRIKQEIEENVVLEEDNASLSENDAEDGAAPAEEPPQQQSLDEYLKEDDTPSYKSRINNFSSDDKERPLFLSGGRSLQEYLSEQLGYRNLTDREMKLANFLIGCFDEDGYLRRDLESISDDLAFIANVEVQVEELERILRIVHQLEPAGIGARDLRECLLLQIGALSRPTKSQRLAKRILTNYFDEFAKRHYEKLISRLQVSEDDFRAAITEVRRLSPKPSNMYAEGGTDSTPYIIPDFILTQHEDRFDLSLNSSTLPEVKISHRYKDMIRSMVDAKGEVKEQDREAVQFVKGKIDSAKWFISAIKQRQDTLMRTMEEILDFQSEYFRDGDPSKLKPMILKDIAERTNLDVSTISRVVNSKYVQTQFGMILLKSLFSEAMQTDSGNEVSSYEIKNILQQCIDDENKRHPMTDETLMDILNAKGYHIARRTVAKYREMLNIPVARLRKQI
ncbi:MAG: RNA polymerase factor sigma-54 [Rikenellaceae bacterium]